MFPRDTAEGFGYHRREARLANSSPRSLRTNRRTRQFQPNGAAQAPQTNGSLRTVSAAPSVPSIDRTTTTVATTNLQLSPAPQPAAQPAAQPAVSDTALQTLTAQFKDEYSTLSVDIQSRVDELGVRQNTLENAFVTCEKSVAALRADFATLSKSTDGQLSESVEAMQTKLQALDEAFQTFSSRMERERQEDQRRFLASAAAEPSGEIKDLRSTVEELRTILDSESVNRRMGEEGLTHWVSNSVVPMMKAEYGSLKDELLPSLVEQYVSRLQTTPAAPSPQDMHRLITPVPARVVRGPRSGEDLHLFHPIAQTDSGETFMLTKRVDVSGAVVMEHFTIQDTDGPTVAFLGDASAESFR